MPGPCPTPERLAAALRGRQPGGGDAELAAHLAECPACQAQLESLAGGSGWLEAKAKTHEARDTHASEVLRRAMRELETNAGEIHIEASAPPKLDFLQPSDQPGVLGWFGPYEVIAHVASGGMGTVLKARDPALNRVVALKILPPALAANTLARARFVREARAAAAVVHEHVVPIYAVDECASLPYIVMQFVQGRSLSERIRATGPLRLEEVLRIGAQTAAGLAAAHAQGLIHRDVKPGNILLENSVERVKLTDFGLARAVDDAGLTRTGELAGTPEFMSPEQANNELVDHRTDLFSFGSVLYAMCAGHSPFHANSVIAAVRKVCDEQPPPVHEINPTVPRWLSDIIARLMAKVPEERFQSARELSELLERYLARVQHGELRPLGEIAKERWSMARSRRRVVIGAAISLGIVAALLVIFKERRTPTSNSSRPAALPERRELASSPPPSTSRPSPFVVRSETGTSVGGFESIAGALAATPAGGVIELCWNGPRIIESVRLPPKPLTLRAGRGFQPAWHSSDAASMLFASAGLTLDGVRFQMTSRARRPRPPDFPPNSPRTPPSGIALLSITNGPLRVTHCTLDAKAGSVLERACIVLANVSVCRIENTLLFAPVAKAIVWRQHAGGNADPERGAGQLTMTNCGAVVAEVFWLDLPESPRTRLEIVRCTFDGPEAFYIPASMAATNLEVDARQNVFHTGSIILDARPPGSPPLSHWMRWREQENLYRPQRRPDERYIAGLAVPDGPARLEDWNRWWNQTGANSRQVQITFANGVSDLKPGPHLFYPETGGFRITDLNVVEGAPLRREQWELFGVDVQSVGPKPQ